MLYQLYQNRKLLKVTASRKLLLLTKLFLKTIYKARHEKHTMKQLRSLLLTMVLRDPKVVMVWRRAVVSASKRRTVESSGLRVKLPSLGKIKYGYF
jgi:hypothetical protein